MKLVSLLLLFTNAIIAQNNTVAISKRTDTIHSKILNEDRYIWVHKPGIAEGVSSKHTYPVIYVLDGQMHFDEVNNILSRISKEIGKDAASEMIVVGIGNIWQRYKDYSPSHIASSPWVDSYNASITGGGEKFISFLEKELIPHINATCPASTTRILIGHSMGGLIAMDILLNHTGLFDYYAAIDPSMWWDEGKLLRQAKTILTNKSFEKKNLFLAVANTKDKNMDLAQIKDDTSTQTVLIRPSLTLLEYINTSKQNKLRFDWKFYKDHHHMTVLPAAAYDALSFFLKSL